LFEIHDTAYPSEEEMETESVADTTECEFEFTITTKEVESAVEVGDDLEVWANDVKETIEAAD